MIVNTESFTNITLNEKEATMLKNLAGITQPAKLAQATGLKTEECTEFVAYLYHNLKNNI